MLACVHKQHRTSACYEYRIKIVSFPTSFSACWLNGLVGLPNSAGITARPRQPPMAGGGWFSGRRLNRGGSRFRLQAADMAGSSVAAGTKVWPAITSRDRNTSLQGGAT